MFYIIYTPQFIKVFKAQSLATLELRARGWLGHSAERAGAQGAGSSDSSKGLGVWVGFWVGAGLSELTRPPSESCHRLDCPTGVWARPRGHHGSIPQSSEAKIFPQSPNEVPKDASRKQ